MTPTLAEVLDLERRHAGRPLGRKIAEIGARWGISDTRYHQMLNAAIDTEEAERLDPITVHRLRRVRAAAQRQRSARAAARQPPALA